MWSGFSEGAAGQMPHCANRLSVTRRRNAPSSAAITHELTATAALMDGHSEATEGSPTLSGVPARVGAR